MCKTANPVKQLIKLNVIRITEPAVVPIHHFMLQL